MQRVCTEISTISVENTYRGSEWVGTGQKKARSYPGLFLAGTSSEAVLAIRDIGLDLMRQADEFI